MLCKIPVTAIWLTDTPVPPVRPGAEGAVHVYIVPAGSVGEGTIKLKATPEQALILYVPCPLTELSAVSISKKTNILFTGPKGFSFAYKIIECVGYRI